MKVLPLWWLAKSSNREMECLFFISTTDLLVFDAETCSLHAKYCINHCDLEYDLNEQQEEVDLHVTVQRQSGCQPGASEQSVADVDIMEKYFKSGQTEEVCQPETIYLYDSEDAKEKSIKEPEGLDDRELNKNPSLSGRRTENLYTMKCTEVQQFITLYHLIKDTKFLQGLS